MKKFLVFVIGVCMSLAVFAESGPVITVIKDKDVKEFVKLVDEPKGTFSVVLGSFKNIDDATIAVMLLYDAGRIGKDELFIIDSMNGWYFATVGKWKYDYAKMKVKDFNITYYNYDIPRSGEDFWIYKHLK